MNFTPRNQRLLWLVRLRFVALFTQLPMTLIGRYYGYLGDSSHILFITVLLLALIYNIFLYRKLLNDQSFQTTEIFLNAQMSLDLILFTFLLSVSGGVNNPFYPFFFVMALLGGIFTSGRGTLFFGVLLVLTIGFIQASPAIVSDISWRVLINQQTLPYTLIQVMIPFITFIVACSFGKLLTRTENRLVSLAVREERRDHLRALGALSAGFSHEFASPLQAAKIRLTRLKKALTSPNADFDECLYALEDCDLVLKKMNSAQLQFHEMEEDIIPLHAVMKETAENWSLDFPEVKVLTGQKEAYIRAPKINLVQVLINLLDNAAEAMNGRGEIILETVITDIHTVLKIQDKGKGFDHDVLHRIGEPFNTNKENGTGLGLYSSILFMQSVAGEIKISNHSHGAEVSLFFPIGGANE